MKKLYFFAAIGAIALASCSSEEEILTQNAQKSINFKAVLQKATRAPQSEGLLDLG